jgi:hypothetical protein
MSPLEKLHARALRRTVAVDTRAGSGACTGVAPSLSAAAEPRYLHCMEALLEEFLDEILLDLPIGA